MHTMSRAAHNVSDAVMKRSLVLHMDINRTIIQTDPAGGKTLEDVLNSNVAARVFGHGRDGKFCPEEGRFDGVANARGSMSYADYVDEIVQPPLEMQTATAEERRAIWKGVAERRRALLHSFTLPGSIGAAYVDKVEQQRNALKETLDRGLNIVPSFFELINKLSENGWPFAVIFRTFGNDIESVLHEWNLFMDGGHLVAPRGPVLAAMRGGSPQCGALFRNEQGIAIAWDHMRSIPPPPNGVDSEQLVPEEYLKSVNGVKDVHAVSYHELYEELIRKCQNGGNVLGLIDYYHYWSQHAEHRSAGKCFPVSMTETAPFQIFFDDNIFIGDPSSIVDMRNAESGEPMALEKEDAYCCHVLPYFAITDADYFWKETLERIAAQLST